MYAADSEKFILKNCLVSVCCEVVDLCAVTLCAT